MHDATSAPVGDQVARLQQRLEQLEARVTELEQQGVAAVRRPAGSGSSSARGSAAAGGAGVAPEWTQPYEVAELEVGETWIEMHEPSARRQLHRLIREVVTAEGPITEQLALRRVREAWGLKRAGARIQQVFDQNIRQLCVQETIERRAGDVLAVPGQELDVVRVPGADEATRRSVDEIPAQELELALLRMARDRGSVAVDELTMLVAKMFGWTRRGTEIQNTLDARVEALLAGGGLTRSAGGDVAAADPMS